MLEIVNDSQPADSTAPQPPLPELRQLGSLHEMSRRALIVALASIGLLVVGVLLDGPTFGSGVRGAVGFVCFLLGLTGSLIFAIVAAIARTLAGFQNRQIRAIAEGDYLWAKRLRPEQIEHVRQTRAEDITRKRASYAQVARYVAVAVLVLVTLPAAFAPELPFLRTMMVTALGLAILFGVLFGMKQLIVWLSNPMVFLRAGANHVVVSADGLLLEPEYWSFHQAGRKLSSVRVTESDLPHIDFVFDVTMNSQLADQHRFSVPLDPEDLPAARLLAHRLSQAVAS